MKTIKKLGLVSAVAFAMLAFSACDDSSSAGGDDNETSAVESSSSVKDSDSTEESSSSIDKKSSGNETKDKSSSSDTKSSSSTKETKVSSDSKSSSSVKSGDSSSSKKDVSSSSATSSSSVKSSSSSSVKQSSSSSNDVQSSSSKQNPWGTDAEWWPFSCNAHGGCLEFTDKRNGRTYKYLKFDDKDTSGKNATIYAMVENLNVGEMVRGFKDQKNDDKIERYCYDNDTLNCHYYGGLYQWAEMMGFNDSCNTKSCAHLIQENHQGICPDGWRLLTYDDFYIIVNSNENTHGVEGVRSAFGFGGYNTTGFSLVGAGYNWQHTFTQMNESTYWHYPQEGTLGDNTSFVGCQSRTETTLCSQSTYKTNGFSVRCVIVNQK